MFGCGGVWTSWCKIVGEVPIGSSILIECIWEQSEGWKEVVDSAGIQGFPKLFCVVVTFGGGLAWVPFGWYLCMGGWIVSMEFDLLDNWDIRNRSLYVGLIAARCFELHFLS